MSQIHPLVKRLLDGELELGDLPSELRSEGAWALRMLADLDRAPVRLSPALDARVMAEVRRAAAPAARPWRWLLEPKELHLRVRPWAALAAAAGIVLVALGWPLARRGVPSGTPLAAAPDSVVVRFVLYAPSAHQVAVAGSFNHWDRRATPLVPAGRSGVWAATVTLAPGQHQYAFVVDGERWLPDPGAPAVDDGFGRRNSLITVGSAREARSL